ncbi:hypothetical protein D3C78_1668320 [compost metagenome]
MGNKTDARRTGLVAGFTCGNGGVLINLHISHPQLAQFGCQQFGHIVLTRSTGQGRGGGIALAGYRQITEETFGELFGYGAGHAGSSR